MARSIFMTQNDFDNTDCSLDWWIDALARQGFLGKSGGFHPTGMARRLPLRCTSARMAIPKFRQRSRLSFGASAGAPDTSHPEEGPEFIQPMKCHLVKEMPVGKEWLYEVKFDGIRAIIVKNGDQVRIYSRARNDLTERFAEVAEGIKKLPCKNAVFDGEVVALDEEGRSSFQLLQSRNIPGNQSAPIFCYVFDLLIFEGQDLRGQPLLRRKELLARLLRKEPHPLRLSPPLNGSPTAILEGIKAHGLEGVIAKLGESKYQSGVRSRNWLKIKTVQQQEFVIGGYTPPEGSRKHFGALLVGYFKNGRFHFASKVGTGFDTRLLKSLHQRFQPLIIPACPFDNLPEPKRGRGGLTAREMSRCRWIEPRLVCEVRFAEWTRDGHLRQPVFLGLRDDKPARDVTIERVDSKTKQ